ncbi:MAG TPA: tripartite tricarboxylate transporter substrate-binding protein [Gammaproteobacteria bacterium]|jgi:tripartite-type tricarboxylate transporter receptor subunit TctC/ABC-type molybdate transport system substrate-binding protein
MQISKRLSYLLALASHAALIAACGAPSGGIGSPDETGSQPTLEVITSGGFSAAYDLLAPRFEAATGIRLSTARGSSSGGAPDSIPVRLDRGETFDVIILSRPSLDRLSTAGFVLEGSATDLVRSSIGMAVREGAPVPDISTPERFMQTVLEAESIGYSASASGTYLSTELFPRVGLWDVIEPRSRRIESERVAAVVARGEVEIGFQQISEILPIPGATFVGPIPEEYQRVTTFAAAVTASSGNVEAARRLIAFLASPEVAAAVAGTGLEPIALETPNPEDSSARVIGDTEATDAATRDSSTAEAGDYPSRPVTFVVAFGVGGSADRMTRTMAPFIGEALGQPVQVVNREGAGTLLGANYLLDQPDDGYTVLASGFSPYLSNTILEGNADYTIADFAYLNFQWFDEDLIAVNADTPYESLPELLEDIRARPKKVKAAVVRGSGGHLMARLLLELSGIPQENLNLVTYNGGGIARAAVAGGIVDFIVISAPGTESISEYIRPLAIFSHEPSRDWNAPTLNEAMAPTGIRVPILPGSIRGFATSAVFRRDHPARFDRLASAIETALNDPRLIELLDGGSIGRRWIGPEASATTMRETFEIFENYSYLLDN